HQKRVKSQLRKAIFNAKDEEYLKKVIATELQIILEKCQCSLAENLQIAMDEISDLAVEIRESFQNEFAEVYHKLQGIDEIMKVKIKFKDKSFNLNSSQVFSSARSFNQQLDSKQGGIAIGGIASGTALGTMVLPGIGTAIGFFIGAAFSGLFMGSLDQRKEKTWEQLEASLNHYLDELDQKLQDIKTQSATTIISTFEKTLNHYLTHYQSLVDEIQQKQKTELQQLTDLKVSTHQTIVEIQKRHKTLST
ncbi:MAG: bacteriocin class II family protein, partial [Brasilonema sp.]